MIISNGSDSRGDDDSQDNAVDVKLKSVAEAAPTKPPWYDAWQELGPGSTEEERLVVYQAVRDSGLLPHEAGFFLVSLQIDDIVTRDAGESLRGYEDRMEVIREEYRFDDGEVWSPETPPEEYQKIQREYHQAWDELFARKLEEFGEQEMARLFRSDRERFEQLTEVGRQYFHGKEDLEGETPFLWVKLLVESVAEHITADSPMGPLGYRYGEEEGFWQVEVYPTPVELVGGAVDGEVVAPGFSLDLEGLRSAFEEITDLGWHSLGFAHAEGPHIWIEGVFHGQEVFLQALAYAPDDEEPGMKLSVNQRRE